MLYFKKSQLQSIIDAYCKDNYSNKPEEAAAIRQALAEILPELPEYCAYFEFILNNDYAEKIADVASKKCYTLDPKIVKKDLIEIVREKESRNERSNRYWFSISEINDLIEKIYIEFNHFESVNKENLLKKLSVKQHILKHIGFVQLISSTPQPERKCLEDHWKKKQIEQCSTGMRLNKKEILEMVDLHLDSSSEEAKILKKALAEVVFLDTLNINEFEEFCSEFHTFYPGIYFATKEYIILFVEWYQMELDYELQQQKEAPVPPGPENESLFGEPEVKIHLDTPRPTAQSVQSVAQLSLDEILSALKQQSTTNLQMIYEMLPQMIQRQQLTSLNHNDEGAMKYAAEEQPAPFYSVASSSLAYTPAASSISSIANNLNPLEAQLGSGMREPSSPLHPAMRNP